MTTRAQVSLLLLIAGCSRSDAPPKPAEHGAAFPPATAAPATAAAPAGSGWYRVVVGEKQGTPIPFYLQLPATGDDAQVATGPDRIHAKVLSPLPSLVVDFDVLHTRFEAKAGDGGVLDGEVKSSSKSWGAAALSFHAEPVAGPDPLKRFPTTPGGPDASGVWKVVLSKTGDPDERGKLVITRDAGGALTGTFYFQTGNMAFVAGSEDGHTLHMSDFDGSSPALLTAELDASGKSFTGQWTAGQALDWKQSLSATKSDDFPFRVETKLAATRPKLNLPLLATPEYRGKPVIVELSGSWCPACANAAPALRELLAKHSNDGLKIVTLMYEFTDDTAYNKRAADQFKAKFQIPWDVIPIDGGLEKYGDILPPQVDAIDASEFPLALFVARDGAIEGFHNSFPPDKWGKAYDDTVADYERLTTQIVASPKTKSH